MRTPKKNEPRRCVNCTAPLVGPFPCKSLSPRACARACTGVNVCAGYTRCPIATVGRKERDRENVTAVFPPDSSYFRQMLVNFFFFSLRYNRR